MRLASQILPEVKAILVQNGIDWTRCVDVEMRHDAEGLTTLITVTMLAVAPEVKHAEGEDPEPPPDYHKMPSYAESRSWLRLQERIANWVAR